MNVKFTPVLDLGYAYEALAKKGYPVNSISSTGVIGFDGDITDQQQEDIQAILSSLPDINFSEMRGKRNSLLFESDWTQLPDSPMSDGQKQQWKIYRKALRDLPEQLLILTEGQQWSWPIPPTDKE